MLHEVIATIISRPSSQTGWLLRNDKLMLHEVIATIISRPSSQTDWLLRNINFSNGNGSFSFYIFFCSLYNRHRLLMDLIIGVTQWMPYNKQELLTPSPVFWCSPCCSSFLLSAMCFFLVFVFFFDIVTNFVCVKQHMFYSLPELKYNILQFLLRPTFNIYSCVFFLLVFVLNIVTNVVLCLWIVHW